MTVMQTEKVLSKHLDRKEHVVLWSSSDYEHIKSKTKGGIVQFIGVFNNEKIRPGDFVEGYVVCIDEETKNVRFVSELPAKDWNDFKKYIVDINDRSYSIEKFAKKFQLKITEDTNKWYGRKWEQGNVLWSLYYKRKTIKD